MGSEPEEERFDPPATGGAWAEAEIDHTQKGVALGKIGGFPTPP